MTEIIINQKRAVPASGTSISLTIENQALTGTSSYTLDVSFPLDIPANAAIFGILNRRDVAHDKAQMDAIVRVDNHEVLVGYAVVTKIDADSVSVQLMGHAAAFNYQAKVSETYIDEMNLGDWYQHCVGQTGVPHRGTAWPIAMEEAWMARDTMFYSNWFTRYTGGTEPWVAFPVVESQTGTLCNEYVAYVRNPATPDVHLDWPYVTPDGQHSSSPQVKFAVQPFIWFMCELIAKASGYTLNRSDNLLYTDTEYRKVFIASADIRVRASACLPHWTVMEWWEQIRNTFGVSLIIDDTSKSLRLVSRDYAFTRADSQAVHLDRVLDRFTCEPDTKTLADISDSDVAFAEIDGSSPFELLPDELRDTADIVVCEQGTTVGSLRAKAKGGQLNAHSVYVIESGRRFIFWPGEESAPETLKEVDQARPRIHEVTPGEESRTSVELKFVPCPIREHTVQVFTSDKITQDDSDDRPVQCTPVTVPVLYHPDSTLCDWGTDKDEIITGSGRPNLAQRLTDMYNGEDYSKDDGYTRDICYIATLGYVDTPVTGTVTYSGISYTVSFTANLPYPCGWRYEIAGPERYAVDDIFDDTRLRLAVCPPAGCRGLAPGFNNDIVSRVDTSEEYVMEFVSKSVPDITAMFEIRGQRYICLKIEVKLINDGLDPLMTGHFFKVV